MTTPTSDVFYITVPIDDEFTGRVEIRMALTREDAHKVVSWAPSVASLYLGHVTGPQIQHGLRAALASE